MQSILECMIPAKSEWNVRKEKKKKQHNQASYPFVISKIVIQVCENVDMS